MNRKIFVGIAGIAIIAIVGLVSISGSSFIDDTSSQGIFSQPSEAPKVLPLEIELEDLSILEVDERAVILEINFKVANPNYKSVLLQLITYEIYENDVKIVSGQIGERAGGMMVVGSNYFLILNEQPSFLHEKITIKNSGNTPELWAAFENNTPKWRVTGEAFFNLSSMTSGGENIIPFEFTK